jgi:asparagine synthetase B (glutamine-hydrolysing)
LFLPDQVARLTGTDPQPLGEALTQGSSPKAAPLARWSQLELRNHLSNTLIRSSDCFTRSLGVDLRFPYVDSRIIDLSLRVPDERKRERGHRKPLMRDLFGGRLPDFVWTNRKRHFHVPLDRWLMRSSYTFRDVSFLNPEEVDRIVRAYRSRPGLRTYSRLWALHVLSESLPRLLGESEQ